jgi:molybdopterin-binding protein
VAAMKLSARNQLSATVTAIIKASDVILATSD